MSKLVLFPFWKCNLGVKLVCKSNGIDETLIFKLSITHGSRVDWIFVKIFDTLKVEARCYFCGHYDILEVVFLSSSLLFLSLTSYSDSNYSFNMKTSLFYMGNHFVHGCIFDHSKLNSLVCLRSTFLICFQFCQAINCYSRANNIKPNDSIILSNRCASYLRYFSFCIFFSYANTLSNAIFAH